jgi:hypothetical protein
MEVKMDNQNDYMVSSREEYIRLARESCLKNLGNNSGEMDTNKKNKVNLVGSPYSYDKTDYGKDTFFIPGGKLNLNQKWIKHLLIRTICALVLFLTIFLVDKLKFTYKELNSQSIETIVTSSKGFDATEDYFVNLFKSFVKEDEAVVNE